MQHPHRKLRRHHLIFYLKVFDAGTGVQLGFLGDVTVEGMMVMSKEPIDLDQVFDIEIRNESGASREERVAARARSMWCQTDVNPEYYATGFRFEELSADADHAIRSLIREIGFDG